MFYFVFVVSGNTKYIFDLEFWLLIFFNFNFNLSLSIRRNQTFVEGYEPFFNSLLKKGVLKIQSGEKGVKKVTR